MIQYKYFEAPFRLDPVPSRMPYRGVPEFLSHFEHGSLHTLVLGWIVK